MVLSMRQKIENNKNSPRKITIICHETGEVEIKSFSLSDDLWQDYEYFLKSVQKSYSENKHRKCNRELRAGLLCLFAHFEGVINYLFYILKSKIGEETGGVDERDYSLCGRSKLLGKIAKKVCGKFPYINYKTIKGLRNIIVHPDGIHYNGTRPDVAQVFDKLNCELLENSGSMMKEWLDAVCECFNTTRMMGTKKMANKFSEAMGKKLVLKEL